MAAPILCNGKVVLRMRLTARVRHAWVATLDAMAEDAITGAVEITDGTNPWKGTVVRSGVVQDVCSAFIVGGAGRFGTPLSAKSYAGVAARSVVTDILDEARESADGKSLTRAELRTVLDAWTRLGPNVGAGGTAGEQLTTVLEHVGLEWRVLPNGTVWMGQPTFQAAEPEGLVERNREGAHARAHVTLDLLDLVPDTAVQGDRVTDVEYQLNSSELRATYWFEDAA